MAAQAAPRLQEALEGGRGGGEGRGGGRGRGGRGGEGGKGEEGGEKGGGDSDGGKDIVVGLYLLTHTQSSAIEAFHSNGESLQGLVTIVIR